MIGFIFLLLAARQIYIIIKNGLTARQIREANTGQGVLVLVEIKNSDHIDDTYLSRLESIKAPHQLYLIAPLDHPQMLEFSSRGFMMANYNHQVEKAIDVINRLSLETDCESILVSDANILFDSNGLFGLEKLLTDNKGPYYIVPQIYSENITIDCLFTLNPNLALISLFSFKRLTRSLRHPLLTMSEICIAYRKKDFELFPDHSNWKSSILYDFRNRAIGLKLCFGEKFFSLYLKPDLASLWQKMRKQWEVALKSKDYSASSFFIQTLIWLFPVLFFELHPFYSIGIFLLLLIYRIFTFIIFQENILSLFVHPIAALMWLVSFGWNALDKVKKV